MSSKSFLIAASSLIVTTLGLAGCGTPTAPEPSNVQGIVTNLPDTGTDGPTHLYWVQQSHIFRGECVAGKPIIKPACKNNLEMMSYDDFKIALDNGLSGSVTSLGIEVRSIEAAITLIEKDMVQTRAAIAAQRQALGAANAQLDGMLADIVKVDSWIQDYKDQLALIRDRLAKVKDQDLRTQSYELARELAGYQADIRNMYAQLPNLITKIESLESNIATLKSHFATLCVRLTNLSLEHERVMVDLAIASDELSVYDETLARTESAIVHRVLEDQALFQKIRHFVKRFDVIFADAGKVAFAQE